VVRAAQYRPEAIATPEYPESHLVENVGERPDATFRYNTIANFSQNGKPFVDAFIEAILADIGRNKAAAPNSRN